jgi:hypothetical protein
LVQFLKHVNVQEDTVCDTDHSNEMFETSICTLMATELTVHAIAMWYRGHIGHTLHFPCKLGTSTANDGHWLT